MIFNSGWTKMEIEALTYRELNELLGFYFDQETQKLFDFFKLFCIYNCESSAVSFASKRGDISRYINEVKRRRLVIDDGIDHIEDQFKGENLGQ